MKVNIRKKIGAVLIVLGILLILAAGVYVGYNMWIAHKAGRAAQEVLDLMPDIEEGSGTPDYLLNPDMEMPTTEINGRRYIGVLEIPCRSLKLAVLSEWSMDGLKISPCRYSGSAYKNDMVIAGHNYRRHFTGIKSMKPGEKVIFRDVVGNVFEYQVTDVEVIQPTDVEGMIKDDYDSWDMTLFTCTTGGSARFALRCRLTAATGQYLR